MPSDTQKPLPQTPSPTLMRKQAQMSHSGQLPTAGVVPSAPRLHPGPGAPALPWLRSRSKSLRAASQLGMCGSTQHTAGVAGGPGLLRGQLGLLLLEDGQRRGRRCESTQEGGSGAGPPRQCTKAGLSGQPRAASVALFSPA